MDGISHSTATQASTEAFLAALTDLSVKHGIGITEDGVLFNMERDDYPYSYRLGEGSRLVRA